MGRGRSALAPLVSSPTEGRMPSFRSILVPVVDTSASIEAVEVAASVARKSRGRIHILHVIEVMHALPLHAEMDTEARKGEQLLRRAKDAIGQSDCEVQTELLQGRSAGAEIVAEARSKNVDAILLGVGYDRLIGDFQMGGTALYVLKHAPCPVWILRQALTQTANVR